MPQLVMAYGYSFPSGHAFSAMMIYGFFMYLIWGMGQLRIAKLMLLFVSIFLIFLVGLSRVYLNVHWLTDVLGGYAAGFAWLVFSIVMVNTIVSKRAET